MRGDWVMTEQPTVLSHQTHDGGNRLGGAIRVSVRGGFRH